MARWTYSRWIASSSFIASLRPSLTALSSRCLCFSKDSSSLAHFLSSSSASYQDKVTVMFFQYSHSIYSRGMEKKNIYVKHSKKSGCIIICIHRTVYCFTRGRTLNGLWKFYTINVNVTFRTGLYCIHLAVISSLYIGNILNHKCKYIVVVEY